MALARLHARCGLTMGWSVKGLLALAAGAVGCGQSHPAMESAAGGGAGMGVGAVAVIDLDAVAQSLGSDKQIVQSITSRQSTLNEQLVKLAQSYQEQLARHQQQQQQTAKQEPSLSRDQAGEEQAAPSDVSLANWQQQANATLTKAKRQVETDLAQHRAQLVAQFREQIKPFAREAARARGLSVIVTRNDSVIYDFTESVDITAAVVESIRKQSQTTSPAQVAANPAGPSTTTR